MAGDLRMWDDDYVEELCDIVFREFLLGNFVQGVPRDPMWDVITQTLNAYTRKDFRRKLRQLYFGFEVPRLILPAYRSRLIDTTETSSLFRKF